MNSRSTSRSTSRFTERSTSRWIAWLFAAALALAGATASVAADTSANGSGPVVAARDAAVAPAAGAVAAPRSASGARAAATRVGTTATTAATGATGVGIDLRLPEVDASGGTGAVRIVLGLTLLALLPALLVCATAFLRIVVVLAMLRHALGMPETPPNTALIGLSLFLTLFTMAPVLQPLNTEALQPFLQGRLGPEAAWERGARPLRDFMVRQTREQDIALMLDIAKAPRPETVDEVSTLHLVPAFMLSELRAAFQIAFLVFLPFLLIDLIVSSVLMALGMMMMPPVTVALPIKLLMFVLVDGWSVLLKALLGSFR